MGCKIACWKAEILIFKRVVCAGNYPLWIALQKINKTGLVHGCVPGQNSGLSKQCSDLFLDLGTEV